MVRLIDQSARTGRYRNGGASRPASFPFAVHPFSSHAREAKREGARSAAVAAVFHQAQAGASAAGDAAASIACPLYSSNHSAAAAAQSRYYRRRTPSTIRAGSAGPGPVRLRARTDGKACARRSRQMPAPGCDAAARPGSAGPAAFPCQGRSLVDGRPGGTKLAAQLLRYGDRRQMPDASGHGGERQGGKGACLYR